MDTRDLVRMANQIATFFTAYPHEEAVAETANHIQAFWDPRMRRALLDHVDQGAAGLHALVIEGTARLRERV